MRIDPIIDGEVLGDPGFTYPGVSASEVIKYQDLLDPITGAFIQTLGGYLIRYDDRVVVVDAGVGSSPVFPMTGGGFRSSLIALGVKVDDVTDVLLTHLHMDHIGWVTQNGKPYFPNATIRVDKRDWEHFVTSGRELADWELAMSHPEEDSAPARLAPIEDKLEFWEGDGPIIPGIDAIDAAGHTPGTTVMQLSSNGERGFLLGDLAHTQPELLNGWTFIVHEDPERAVQSVVTIRNRLADEQIPCAAAHFPGLRWGKVVREGDEYTWVDLKEQ